MEVKEDRYYTQGHEWIKMDKDIGFCGITDIAQNMMGDIAYVEVEEVGTTVQMRERIGYLEAAKASSDIYAPVSGEIVEINEEIFSRPHLINRDPYGLGWIYKIRVINPGELEELLNYEQYATYVETSL